VIVDSRVAARESVVLEASSHEQSAIELRGCHRPKALKPEVAGRRRGNAYAEASNRSLPAAVVDWVKKRTPSRHFRLETQTDSDRVGLAGLVIVPGHSAGAVVRQLSFRVPPAITQGRSWFLVAYYKPFTKRDC